MKKIITGMLCIALLFTAMPLDKVWAESSAESTEAELNKVERRKSDSRKGEARIAGEGQISVSASAQKSGIKVKWNKVKSSGGYYIYRSTSENGKYKKIKTIKKWKTSKYTDKKVKPNKTYYYKISPRKNADGSKVYVNSAAISEQKVASAQLNVKKSFKVKAYAYTGGGTTASGKKAKVGRIAVDPKVIKLGTWLYVEGYGICQACDTGGNIKGKKIDVYKKSEKSARKWGARKPKVYILG